MKTKAPQNHYVIKLKQSCFDEERRLLAEALLAYPEPFQQKLNAEELLTIATEYAEFYKQPEVSAYLVSMKH